MAALLDPCGYYDLLGIDTSRPVTDGLVSEKFRAAVRVCYQEGSSEPTNKPLYAALVAALNVVGNADGRELYERGFMPDGSPIRQGMRYQKVRPGTVKSPLFDETDGGLSGFWGRAKSAWMDSRVRAGKPTIPRPYFWDDPIARFLVLLLVGLITAVFVVVLAVFWDQMFDVIHFVEWLVWAIIWIIEHLIDFIMWLCHAVHVFCHAIRQASENS